MQKFWLLVSSLVLAVVLVVAGGCLAGGIERDSSLTIPSWVEAAELGGHLGVICSQQNVGLAVTGEGEVMAAPDIALLRLGIEAEAKTVAEAQREAAEAMNEIMKALERHGVSEKDIQTQRFSIYPVWRWFDDRDRQEIVGYRVSNIVVVKIREVDKAGIIIDAVVKAGGNLTRVEDISFTVDDPSPYYTEAREKAVENAMAKAKQIAEVAGVKLGKLIYISEGATYVPPIRDFYKGEATTGAPLPTPVSPGEMEFQLTVYMVYEIY